MTDTLDLTPSFHATACILLAVLQDGTPKGQAMAADEIMRWAGMLDALKAAQNAEKVAS